MVGERLVGLARVLDDSELVAFVHYVLVHPEYQGQKIAGNMVEYIRDKYKNYLYIEGMQEDSKNVAFYERHGFHVMEGGTPIHLSGMRYCLDIMWMTVSRRPGCCGMAMDSATPREHCLWRYLEPAISRAECMDLPSIKNCSRAP